MIRWTLSWQRIQCPKRGEKQNHTAQKGFKDCPRSVLSDLEGSASVCRGCWDALAAPVTLKGWWDALSLQYRVYAGMRWVSSTLSCS